MSIWRKSKNHKTNKQKVVLFLDIRSSSVGGAFALFSENKLPEILYTTRIFKNFKEKQDSDSFTKSMLRVINEVLNDLHGPGLKAVRESSPVSNIQKAFIVYSSPWYVSKIKNIVVNKKTDFIFTEKMFEELVKKESETFKETEGLEIIEKVITHVKINGYQTNHLFGRKITNLDLSFFISEMSKKTSKEIREKIINLFPIKEITNHTHPLTIFTLLRDKLIETSNFMFFDIGGEVTEIGIVQNDSLVQNITVPFGKNYFIREIYKNTKKETAATISSLNMIAENTLDEELTKKERGVLDNAKKEWLKNVSNTISLVTPLSKLPHRVFLTADLDSSKLFLNIIKSREAKSGLFQSENDIVASIINNKIIEDSFSYNKICRKDSFIELAISFVHNNS